MSRITALLLNQLKGFSHFELIVLISMIIILATLFATFDYLKSVILCFQLKGPPARFLLGNVFLLIDENGKKNGFRVIEGNFHANNLTKYLYLSFSCGQC